MVSTYLCKQLRKQSPAGMVIGMCTCVYVPFEARELHLMGPVAVHSRSLLPRARRSKAKAAEYRASHTYFCTGCTCTRLPGMGDWGTARGRHCTSDNTPVHLLTDGMLDRQACMPACTISCLPKYPVPKSTHVL